MKKVTFLFALFMSIMVTANAATYRAKYDVGINHKHSTI